MTFVVDAKNKRKKIKIIINVMSVTKIGQKKKL